MKKLLLLGALSVSLISLRPLQGQTLETDSLALLKLYHALNGPTWNNSWDLEARVSEWSYVRIDDGRVTGFDIYWGAGESITGDIPEAIKDLTALRVFAIRSAQLFEPFPTCLCEMTSLTNIVFENTYLYGPLPDCIGNLTNLEGLSIPRNLMTGHIPESFYSLTKLYDVDLSINKFTGTISEDIGNLTSLHSLKLGANDFYGFLPASLGEISPLVWFTFGGNRFEGVIPASLSEKSNLVSLEANDNRLSGFESDFLSYDQRILTFGDNFISEMPDITDLSENGVFERIEAYENPSGFDDMLLNEAYFKIRNPSHYIEHKYVSGELGEALSLEVSDKHASNAYTWYKDDILIGSSTDPTLSIASYQASDAGKYSCYITNSALTQYEFVEHFHVNVNGITVKIFDHTGQINTEDTLYIAPDFENELVSFKPRSIKNENYALIYNPDEGAWHSDGIVGIEPFHFLVNRGAWMTAEIDTDMNELVRSYDPATDGDEISINVTHWYDLRPLPPTDLSISLSGRDVELAWSAPASTIDGYLVYRDDELISTQTSLAYIDEEIPATKKLSYTIYSYRGTHISDPASIEFSSPEWGEQINVILMIGDELMAGVGANNGTYETPRMDVLVVDYENTVSGDLKPGLGLTSSQSGIELAFGNRLGDVSENPLAIVKVTKENSSLLSDWLSTEKSIELGTAVGGSYESVLDAVQEYLDPGTYSDYPFANPKLSGIIWMHKFGDESDEEYLTYVSSLISDLHSETGQPEIYLVQPGNNESTSYVAKSAHMQSIADQNEDFHFIETESVLSSYTGGNVEDFHEDLDAFNEVGLSILNQVFYDIDLAATPNDHLVSFCVNDQETYQFEDYVSGRHFNVALLAEQDSMVSEYMMSEYVKSYDIMYELYWDLFGWGYLGGEQGQQAHLMLAGGGGAGLGGVCASTRDVGYAITEDFGAPTGEFVTGLSAYSGASGTLIHELIHAFDGRANLFLPSGDQAHALTGAYEPLAYSLTGIGQPLPNQAFLNPYFTLRFHERMHLDRWLTKDDLVWDDIFGDDAMEALYSGSYIMPRHKKHMLINAGIMMSLYEMHTEEHATLMNGIYQYAKDQDGGSLSHTERVDNWIRGAATALNLDVSDYFDYWKYPISDDTRTWLSSFPTSSHIEDHDSDGFSKLEGDWEDDDDSVYPEAQELADGKDNNLNGLVDEDVILDEQDDITSVASSLPFVIVGEATDASDVDEVTFTLEEESFVTFLIWWKDGHETKAITDRNYSTEAFQGSVKLNGGNILYPMQQWHSTPVDSHSRGMEAGTYTVSIQPEDYGDYPANAGEYELYVFVNDFKPDPFHYNGLVYQPKVFYGLEQNENWDPDQALGVPQKEAKALRTLFMRNGGEHWKEDGWMSSYEVPYWKNVHAGKDGLLYLRADLSSQDNKVLPYELADLENIYRVDFGDQEVCGGQAVVDWLDSTPVVETPYTYCEEGDAVVKVFILAGQSNMQGYGTINGASTPGTLEYILANDETGSFAKVEEEGAWKTLEDVWIYFDRGDDLVKSQVTVGQGVNSEFIGPELMLAHELDEAFDEPILIIKTAWGGKSLAVDFRPPSAGGTTGPYYNEMINIIENVTSNLSTEFPEFNTSQFEYAGFGWFQGWNDGESGDYLNEYASNLRHLIADMRDELDAPRLPVVIANTGQGGYEAHPDSWINGLQTVLVPAQESVACDRDFEGTVGYVDTRGYYYDPANSPADAGHHFHNSALAYLNIGQQMGKRMIEAINEEAYCSRVAQTITFELANEILATTGNFELNATSDAGLTVYFTSSDESIISISGITATVHAAGEVSITASQDGDDSYEPAVDVVVEVDVIKDGQNISFQLDDEIVATIGTFELNATSDAALPVNLTSSDESVISISGTNATVHTSGEVTITASQEGNDFYEPAGDVVEEVTVFRDEQTITFTISNIDQLRINQSFQLEAEASSGLEVSYESSNPNVISIDRDQGQVEQPGTTTITASQEGDHLYNPAESVEIQVEIAEDTPVLGLTDLTEIIYSPNPTDGLLFVTWEDPMITELSIISLDGKEHILQQDTKGKRETTFDLSQVQPGLYVLKTNTRKVYKIKVE